MGRNVRALDLTGDQYGFLKVVRRAPDRVTAGGNIVRRWECTCACGRTTVVDQCKLRSLHTKSCGKCGVTGPSHELDDLTGQQFGFLTVLCRAEDHVSTGGNLFVAWECECECGEHTVVTAGHLKTGHVRSCGKCGKYDRSRDFTGEKIGRLLVIEKSDDCYVYPNGDRDFKWFCRCDCGNMVVTRGNTLRNKRFVQSCGCWRHEESVKDDDMLGRDFGACHVVSRADRIHVSATSTVDAWNCICKCGTQFVARGPQLRIGKTVSCGCLSTSKWEVWTAQFLDVHDVVYDSQKWYPDLRGVGGRLLTYDFYLPAYDVLIECQGCQHYRPVSYFGGVSTFDKQVEHDRRKRKYAEQNGLTLVEVDCSMTMSYDAYCTMLLSILSKHIVSFK